MKFFISASVLSLMVFYSSLLPVLHSLTLYFSATIHKNYMFLLCNGLLVFIVRNSGLIGSSDQPAGAPAAAIAEDSKTVESKVAEEEERENGSVVERESESFPEEEEEEEEEEEVEEELKSVAEESDEEEIGILSTEELNKKCEEFIRKMKAGIKFESQQQQLLVF